MIVAFDMGNAYYRRVGTCMEIDMSSKACDSLASFCNEPFFRFFYMLRIITIKLRLRLF